ncbi:hypothetical protein L6452_05865 [Arctium lappa]|uniref:Uncharacterized protein n=1 Tax=Arctium lappa TaxID=4217 RepID=A0ACB9EIM3_ARCLA|nr:hypothetical protein L6452_05865 [Arctium lappa]
MNVMPETIGALDEDEDEKLVDFSTTEVDAFSSPERPHFVMRDVFESEETDAAEEEEEIEMIDVEEYVHKNSQPHHPSTSKTKLQISDTAELEVIFSSTINDTPPQSPKVQAKEPETTPLSAEENIVVVDEQAPPTEPVPKTSIVIPTISRFT